MIVHSTYGDFEINAKGQPLDHDAINAALYEPYDGVRINRFDLDEYKKTYGKLDTEYDILDLGYWHIVLKLVNGDMVPRNEYVGPDKGFRERVQGGI